MHHLRDLHGSEVASRDPSPSSMMSPRFPIESAHLDSTEPVIAKLYEYRGERVAGFEVHGRHMICLPQLYEIFLKTLVGGLHTVYTKLKRLEIRPVVCNVEQVRALRSLGAIQAGVNRCKLISCDDFDRLYEDCHSSWFVFHNNDLFSLCKIIFVISGIVLCMLKREE
ncbi:unnamed protein product [Toxocara canis]|uniref:Ski_Sno domain-containing protein n=1 Tax=Toxocara canis TaxID=6265 RepID=A0A183UTM4_TOXCA|nr:unnamed protein product [Toxocara canis]